MKKPSFRLPGTSEAALAKVAASAAATISVADACTREAFLDAWARALGEHAQYLREAGAKLEAPVVLIHVPDAGAFAREHLWTQRRMLGSSPGDNLAGILAVGTSESGAVVHPDRFTETGCLEHQICQSGLDLSPTIGLFSESKLQVWPDGIAGNAKPFVKDLIANEAPIDIKTIDADLDDFYELFARETRRWWKDREWRTTVDNPEGVVQYDLWTFLVTRHARVARIKKEDKIGAGRADITVIPIDAGGGNESAVLELKTLRDVRTPQKEGAKPAKIPIKENIRWACSGIQQTADYRDNNQMDGGFLCLFDFCAGNKTLVLEAVQPAANAYGIVARRFWITVSQEEHRAERYPLATE